MRVWRLSVAYTGPISRTQRPIERLKLVERVRHTWLGHQFQGQKIKGQLAGAGHIVAASRVQLVKIDWLLGLPRDAMRTRGLCRRLVSVRPSVTFVYCIQRAKNIDKLLSRLGNPIVLDSGSVLQMFGVLLYLSTA